jgi:hypothetical protein
MLAPTTPKAQECHRHAADARVRALETDDAQARAGYLDIEQRWLRLAESFEFAARLTLFVQEKAR